MGHRFIISLMLIISFSCQGQEGFTFNQHNSEVLTDTLIWNISSVNECDTSPWAVEQFGNFATGSQYDITYTVSDSYNCGGTCVSVQSGEVVANIYTSVDKELSLDFEGIGEKESSSFEKIQFYLNDELVAEGHAPGGNLGCEMGAIVPVYYTTFPITIDANTITSLRVSFSTVDGLYHVGAYYYIFLQLSN